MCVDFVTPYDKNKTPLNGLETIEGVRPVTTIALMYDEQLISINCNELRPGDVFLFHNSEKKPGLDDLAISAYQEAVSGSSASKWQHVAILDEAYNIWDAMPSSHVRCRPLRDVLSETAEILIVRPQVDIDSAKLSRSLLKFSRGSYRIYSMHTGFLLLRRLGGRLIPALHRPSSIKKAQNRIVICVVFCGQRAQGRDRESVFSRYTCYYSLKLRDQSDVQCSDRALVQDIR